MANATPHTHEMTVRENHYSPRLIIIEYGDQKKTVNKRLPFWEARLRRKTKRIVKKHDKGSLAYAKKVAKIETAQQIAQQHNERLLVPNNDRYYNGRLEPFEGAWGTDKPEVLSKAKALHEAYKIHEKWKSNNWSLNAKIDKQAFERGQKQLTA